MTKSQFLEAAALHSLAFALAAVTATSAQASISPNSTVSSGMQATKDALDRPLMERIQALKGDSHAYENLKSLMFTKSASMDVRWKAVTAFGRIGGVKAKSDLVRALQAPEWYLRNAGLIALSTVDRSQSLTWARKLLNDKALVVRVAAVDIISQSRDAASIDLLWAKLYSKENFRNKQSLFIRRRIVEALSDLDGKTHASKFVALLADKDASLHEPAMDALQRITNHSIGNGAESIQSRRAQWQQWYKENKATL